MFGNNPASVADNPSVLTIDRPMKGRFSGASGFMTSTVAIAPGDQAVLAMDTVDWDTDGYFAATKDGFGVPWNGFYRFECLAYTTETDAETIGIQIEQITGTGYNNFQNSGTAQGPNPWGAVGQIGEILRLDVGATLVLTIFNTGNINTVHVGGSMAIDYRGHI